MQPIQLEIPPYWWTKEDPLSMPWHSSRPTAPPLAVTDLPPLPLRLYLRLRPRPRPPIQWSTLLADLERCPQTGPTRPPLIRGTSLWLRVPVRLQLRSRGSRD